LGLDIVRTNSGLGHTRERTDIFFCSGGNTDTVQT